MAVLGGGTSGEHEVSLASAASVAEALRAAGAEVVELTVARDGGWRSATGGRLTPAQAVAALTRCDAAFPVLHGEHGEDGTAAGFLDLVGVPLVGSPVRAGALALDKERTKLVAASVGVATAPGVVIGDSGPVDPASWPFDLPVVVKPTTGGSSDGVSVVTRADELDRAVEHARAAGDAVLVEAFVRGREVDLALHRDRDGRLRAGAPLEVVVPDDGVFDRASKYDGSAVFEVPARLAPAEHDALLAASTTLYDALGCAGVARFDFFVTADGPVLNEVNTTPGLGARSQVPLMYEAVGTDRAALVGELVAAALAQAGRTCSAWGPFDPVPTSNVTAWPSSRDL